MNDEQKIDLEQIIDRLAKSTVGLSIHTKKWQLTKALTPDQKKIVADKFGTDVKSIRAGKVLVENPPTEMLDVIDAQRKAKALYLEMTIPYPEKNVRALSRDDLKKFTAEFAKAKNAMLSKVEALNRKIGSMKQDAKNDLKQLYNEADYPSKLDEYYDLSYDVRDLRPPRYLMEVAPEIYEEQIQQANDRLRQGVELLEMEFLKAAKKILDSLVTGLGNREDGKKGSLRKDTVDKLTEFFKRFERLDLGSSGQLTEVIRQAKELVDGRDAKSLTAERAKIHPVLSEITTQVGQMIESRVTRSIELEPLIMEDESVK